MFHKRSGNCRITHPNKEILSLWHEIWKLTFSLFLYTHFVYIHIGMCIRKERKRETMGCQWGPQSSLIVLDQTVGLFHHVSLAPPDRWCSTALGFQAGLTTANILLFFRLYLEIWSWGGKRLGRMPGSSVLGEAGGWIWGPEESGGKPQRMLGSAGRGLDGAEGSDGSGSAPPPRRACATPARRPVTQQEHECHWRMGRDIANGRVKRAGQRRRGSTGHQVTSGVARVIVGSSLGRVP